MPFRPDEEAFIRAKYGIMSTAEIARTLGKDVRSIRNKATNMGLSTKGKKVRDNKKDHKDEYIGSLSDTEKRQYFEREIRNSARFISLQSAFDDIELNSYAEKYVEFMMDPTIETMTSMEKDIQHQMFIAEIRVVRHSREEKESREANIKNPKMPIISRAKEIKECQEIIIKCQASLNVERVQRLKNQSDQAITFTNLIRDLKNPNTRMKAGREAAMLKYMAEKYYNDKVGKNIISGKDSNFDLGANFKDGKAPDLSSDFTPAEPGKENEKEARIGATETIGDGS